MNAHSIAISINREGRFMIQPEQFCDAQCGYNEQVEYGYFVSITATGSSVKAPQMFLLDNMVIREYFLKKFVEERCTVRSCEIIALDAVEHFTSLFRSAHCGVSPLKVLVRIHGANESYIEATWPRK